MDLSMRSCPKIHAFEFFLLVWKAANGNINSIDDIGSHAKFHTKFETEFLAKKTLLLVSTCGHMCLILPFHVLKSNGNKSLPLDRKAKASFLTEWKNSKQKMNANDVCILLFLFSHSKPSLIQFRNTSAKSVVYEHIAYHLSVADIGKMRWVRCEQTVDTFEIGGN